MRSAEEQESRSFFRYPRYQSHHSLRLSHLKIKKRMLWHYQHPLVVLLGHEASRGGSTTQQRTQSYQSLTTTTERTLLLMHT